MRKILIILFWLLSISLGATDYYVKTGGNDAANGLTDGTAWAHHPWMSTWTGSVTLTAGDNVYMKKGDTWTSSAGSHYMTVAQSGTAGNYITTGAYGSGNRPIIQLTGTYYAVIYVNSKSYLKFDGLNIDHQSGAYSTNEGSGIYMYGYTSPCHHIVITNCEIGNIPYIAVRGRKDVYRITVGDTTQTVTATTTAYSNNIHHYGYAGILLTGCNPVTDRSDWKVYYNYVHDITYTTANVPRYGIQFTINTGTSHDWPRYAWCNYNKVDRSADGWVALGTHGGSYIYFQNNYVKGFGRTGIGIGSDAATTLNDHMYVENNIVEQTTGWYSPGAENSFINSSIEATAVNCSYVYFRNNTCFWTTRPTTSVFRGIKINLTDHAIISGNTVYNGGTSTSSPAIYIQGPHNTNVEISKNFVKNWGPSIQLDGQGILGAVDISYNIVDQPGGNACLYIATANLPSTAAVTVYNNTFIQGTYSYVFNTAYGITAGGSFIAKNNILGRASSGDVIYWRWLGTISGTFTCDNNLYWNTSTSSPFVQAGTSYTFATWKSSAGHDGNSPNVSASLDPLFLNAGGSYSLDSDFEISSGSPAINRGVNVGLTTDYDGQALNGLPDIGAWELESPTIDPVVVLTVSVVAGTTQATCGGNVTDDGGGTVSDRGVCWSLTANPTTTDSHTSDGSGTGSYVSLMTGLTPNTTYHARAYAVNEVGTGYGADVSFTTLNNTIPSNGNYIFFNGKPVFFENKIVVEGVGVIPPNVPPFDVFLLTEAGDYMATEDDLYIITE